MKHNPRLVEAFWKSHGLAVPMTEHKFASDIQYIDTANRRRKRAWAFDYAWVVITESGTKLVALEVEGGVWTGGRHTSGAGFVKDMDKYNEASCRGWKIIRVQPCDLLKTKTAEMIKRCLA
jgi:hypothetical protein